MEIFELYNVACSLHATFQFHWNLWMYSDFQLLRFSKNEQKVLKASDEIRFVTLRSTLESSSVQCQDLSLKAGS